ncbi:MAG: hypothetical protein V7723_07555 [Sneathiella sp.]|uniref:hypothetical protein n=1 Tax=Sneathiella sp. TaxID=1964365 RepID=UPI0030035376
MTIKTKPDHGEPVIEKGGIIGWLFQTFIDDVDARLNDDLLGPVLKVPTKYTVLTVPDAGKYEAAIIYVSNDAGGAVLAFSDGTNWRRVTDRAVIS